MSVDLWLSAMNVEDQPDRDDEEQRLAVVPASDLVLAVFAHGRGYVVTSDLDDGLREFMVDGGVSPDESGAFALDDYFDVDRTLDGIVVGKLVIFDDGPGDWPGSREYGVRLDHTRAATADEWRRFTQNEWPWDDCTGKADS